VSRLVAFVFAIVMAAGLVGAATAERLTPRAFTEVFAAAVTAALPTAKVTIAGDLHLETRSESGKTITTDLHNAYQVYLGDPEHPYELIKRYVAVVVDSLNTKSVVDRSRIVPVLKSVDWVEAVQQQRKGAPATQLLTEPFNNELTVVFAEDQPSSVRYLMARDDVGDHIKLHDLALSNLYRVLPHVEMRPGPDGIFLVDAGGEYEPSLLLADDVWSSGQIKVDGDIVVAVPSKSALLVTGSHDRAGIAGLRAISAELAKGPYALTAALFVYRGGKWVKFEGD
jgi:uncharacterized protein YtpQ (UPF0354 family)